MSPSPAPAFSVSLCTAETYQATVPGLAELLHSCVHQGASINFTLPFSLDEATTFWQQQAGEVAEGKQLIFVARSTAQYTPGEDALSLAGCVILKPASQPNGRHRGDVGKMLVHHSCRRRGLGSLLLQALEKEARARGRWLLTLDTEAGSPAEGLYVKEGYQKVGIIPVFASDNSGKAFVDTQLFYKRLA